MISLTNYDFWFLVKVVSVYYVNKHYGLFGEQIFYFNAFLIDIWLKTIEL